MQDGVMQRMWQSGHISGGNAAYVEDMYESYLCDPYSVTEQWRDYFASLPQVNGSGLPDVPHSTVREHFAHQARLRHRTRPAVLTGAASSEHEKKQVQVLRLVNSYRLRGHQKARLDPLGLMARVDIPDLKLDYHGLSEADADTQFQTGTLFIGKEYATLAEIRSAMESTYCGSIGAEFMHIVDTDEQLWFQQKLESVRGRPDMSLAARLHVLERLTAAEGLEKYLGTRYPGT